MKITKTILIPIAAIFLASCGSPTTETAETTKAAKLPNQQWPMPLK